MIIGVDILWQEVALYATFCLAVIVWAEIKGLG